MSAQRKVNVLVVENSNAVRVSIARIFKGDSQIQLLGMVRNGREALRFLERKQPDVILMEVAVPADSGLAATRRIMEAYSIPIVICSSVFDPRDAAAALEFLESGAVACVKIPPAEASRECAAANAQFVQTLKLMSEVKVVRRWPRTRKNAASSPATQLEQPLSPGGTSQRVNLIGIGASTGGPPVLQTILKGLPDNFAVPILIVQHISRGFVDGLIDWLNQTTKSHVEAGVDGCIPLPGHVYIAPDNLHMGVSSEGAISLVDQAPDNGLRPSVSHLFRSMANTFGSTSVGVLLTGMGKDGAKELKLMRQCGATTIAQDRASSVVHGMPGEAIAIGAANCVLPADVIAPALLSLVQRQPICQGASS